MPPAKRRPAAQDSLRDQARAMAQDADVTRDTPSPARPKAEAPAHPDSESVAAKLQRIRAVVGGVTPTAAAATAFVEDLEDVAPPALRDEARVVITKVAPDATEAPEAATLRVPDSTVAPDGADATVSQDDSPADAPATLQAVAVDDPDFRTLDAQLQDQNVTTTPAVALSDIDTDAAIARAMAVFGGMDDSIARQTDATAPDTGVVITDATDPAQKTGADQDDTDDEISAVLRNLQRAGLRTVQRDIPAAAEDAAADAPTDPVAEAQPSPRGRILRVTRRPRPAGDADTSDTPAQETPTAMPPAAPVADAAPPPVTSPSSVAAMIAAAQQAKRAAAAAPVAATKAVGTDAPDPDDTAPTARDADAQAPREDQDRTPETTSFAESVATRDGSEDLPDFDRDVTGSTLSEEDEADLQRTLAALKAEDDDDDDDVPSVVTSAAPVADHGPKSRRDPLPDTSEAEMSRIMSQANEELADPEASRRRDAIAHLKAAVAATEAARQLGDTGVDVAMTEDAFRDDLEQVVRPRRAPRSETTTDRTRPAPLKLVASQRIDLEHDATPARTVQPRRVATEPVAADDAGNFAEFAESMGASSLQDLLEAAAAYTAYVEGSEDFSRPHIMQKVRQTVTEDFSREDGLRSFGTLLRQGRIERARNGRFTVSDQNRFKPDAMAAGG